MRHLFKNSYIAFLSSNDKRISLSAAMRDGLIRVAYIPGDGIGPKVVELARRVVDSAAELYRFGVEWVEAPAGDKARETLGEPLPSESLERILGADAVLKGPVGETARDVIVYLRRRLDLYANLRPFKTYLGVKTKWSGVDLLIVRENTEDLYKGIEDVGWDHAVSLLVITRKGSERIARTALRLAEARRKKLTIVHKANVLRSYGFFRDVCMEVAEEFPGVEVEEMYVDNAAYQLVVNPQRFDVILTPNMFGDILSDEAAALIGSLGLTCSANVGEKYGLFEPVHGSAPDIDPSYANPIGQILTSSMMLEWLSERKREEGMKAAADAIKEAVEQLLREGRTLTPDLGGSSTADEVAEKIIHILTTSV